MARRCYGVRAYRPNRYVRLPSVRNVFGFPSLDMSNRPFDLSRRRVRSGRARGSMKHVSVFNILRATVTIGALVGALAAPAAVGAATRHTGHSGLTNAFYRTWNHTNPSRADSDRDGISDARENPDHDGLNNRQEQRLGDNPLDADTNNNGTVDGNEDEDHDGLDDQGEFKSGTSPSDADSNNDGV